MADRSPSARGRALSLSGALCGVVLVATTALPWVQTGSARRSSYRLLRDLALLGLLDSGAEGAGRVAWVFLPALVAVAVLLLVLGRSRWAGGVLLVAGLVAGAGVAAVARAPVSMLWGASATGVVAALTVPISLALVLRRRPRSDAAATAT